MRFRLLLVLLCIAVAPAYAATARLWLTTADGQQRLAPQPDVPASKPSAGGLQIRVDDARQFQPVEGFGASFSESSSWLIQRLPDKQRQQLLRELFDRESGLGLSVTRVPMGGSDFSRTHGTYDDMPAGQTDPALEKFSLARAQGEVLPALRAALAINPGLKVFLSPWSAPAWMKTSGSLIKGRLDPKHYDAFARYFDQTLAGFKAQGVPVYGITLQNEPHFEPGDYPGMRVEPAERAAFIGNHLGPLLQRQWPQVKLFDWDHNWDQPESPLAVLADAKARPFIAGVAWHCYGGDVSAQSPVQEKYPQIETWMTECSGGNWAPKWSESLAWMTQNLVIGNLRHWGRGTILWNLALDENSGPHLGGCGDCRGVVTVDSKTGAVTRNVEYYVLGHASRFMKSGARRIHSDSDVQGLHSVALLNADGSIALILLNASAEPRSFAVVGSGQSFATTFPPGAVGTLVWQRPRP